MGCAFFIGGARAASVFRTGFQYVIYWWHEGGFRAPHGLSVCHLLVARGRLPCSARAFSMSFIGGTRAASVLRTGFQYVIYWWREGGFRAPHGPSACREPKDIGVAYKATAAKVGGPCGARKPPPLQRSGGRAEHGSRPRCKGRGSCGARKPPPLQRSGARAEHGSRPRCKGRGAVRSTEAAPATKVGGPCGARKPPSP